MTATEYERTSANRRKKADLVLKSVWDEPTLTSYLPLEKHRIKLWNYCIQHAKSPFITENANDKRRVRSFNDIPMAEWCFPVHSIEKIKQECKLFTTSVAEISGSSRGDTTKLLIRLQDGHHVETVVIRHKHHATACISSQIGCQMGCRWKIITKQY